MTNLTKAIAVLGVVAGLGVAALPLSSYAADNTVKWAPSTDTENHDATKMGGDGTAKDPMWVQNNVGVQLTIEEGIQISTSNATDEKVQMAQKTGTNEFYSAGFKVNVIANNTEGYHLQIKGSATENATSLTNDAKDTIATLANTDPANTAALALNSGKSVWGYGVGTIAEDSTISEATTFTGLSASFVTIAAHNEGATPAAGIDTPVTFGALVADDQASGTYSGQVTFRATAAAEASPDAGA